MGSKTLFCYLVHSVTPNLYFYPSSLLRHQCDVQSLVAIGLRMVQPVTKAVRMSLVDFAHCHVDVKAFVDLFLPYLRGENDADSENIVDLIERDMLVLHFIPNGIRTLHSRLDFVFYPHFVQRSFDGSRKLFEKFVALLLSKGQFAVDVFVFNGMFKLETKVFKLCLNLV